MGKYILRLDDASEKRNIKLWNKMEEMLDEYKIHPLVGIIPHCEDVMMESYDFDDEFIKSVHRWKTKGWTIAMHGYNHVYSTQDGGINPINMRSEFAGESLKVQKEKVSKGIRIMSSYGVDPKVFFAPSHTFDKNTILALLECSNIRIISDTIANKPYRKEGMIFVPQQSGRVRNLPFNITTFCYHPNVMKNESFKELEKFIYNNKEKFIDFDEDMIVERKKSLLDNILERMYFIRK